MLQDAELIEFSKIVELTATEVLEGMHSARRGGEGIEYHSSLPYQPGEDARRVDWKKFAATDRLFVNRFEREEKTSWRILIDSSKSMQYGNKALWANLWAGSLIFLAKIWGDRWTLMAPSKPSTLEEALELLAQNKGGDEKVDQIQIDDSSTDRLVVVSDFFWKSDTLKSALERWKSKSSHLYFVQPLDRKEIDFKFQGVLEFRDLESVDRLILDATRIASKYRKALRGLQSEIDSLLGDAGSLKTFQAETPKLRDQLLEFFEAI